MVVGTDQAGSVVQRVKFRRETLLAFFEHAESALIGMERAQGRNGSMAREEAQAFGHGVRIVPAQFVKL